VLLASIATVHAFASSGFTSSLPASEVCGACGASAARSR
jgi:hypothetical protein